MTRPRYETAADRARELTVAEAFAKAKSLDIRKMPHGHRADFELRREGNLIGYIEIKTRTCNSNTYGTYHISKDKLLALKSLGDRENTKVALVVRWKDRIGYITVKTVLDNASFKMGGRWDRGDKFDVEEMAEVDIRRYFKFL
jgi:hypothetical protein